MVFNFYSTFKVTVFQTVFLSILNQAAYIAGKANKVKAVATIKPPMIAIAIGPQKTLRDKGIMAKTAAAAVKMMGL